MSEVSDKIARILEDPESLKMISEIAESFAGSTSSENTVTDGESKNIVNTELISSEKIRNHENNDLTAISSAIGKLMKSGDVENTVRLISALKPYMSPKRRDGADSVLRILSIMKLAGSNDFQNMVRFLGNS